MDKNALLDGLMEALGERMARQGRKEATGTPTSNYAFGPGGLFSTAGVNQDVLSTVVTAQGMLQILQAYPTVFMNPLFQYVTGFLDDTGSNPTTECADCKI